MNNLRTTNPLSVVLISIGLSIGCGAAPPLSTDGESTLDPATVYSDSGPGPELDSGRDEGDDTIPVPQDNVFYLEGVVLDGKADTAMGDVSIAFRRCPSCSVNEDQLTSTADGIFRVEAATKEELMPAGNALAVELKLSKPGYQPRVIYVRPRFAKGEMVASLEAVELYPTTEPDSDGDGLADALEVKLGIDPDNGDTDADGIPDDYEVNGCNWLDYRALGVKPTMRDLLIEVDYQHYQKGGKLKSARLSDALVQKATEFWASLPVNTPLPGGKSTTGIAVHFVQDSELAEDFSCYYSGADKEEKSGMGDHSPAHKLFETTFHKATLCITSGSGFKGNNHISGRGLRMSSPNTNLDPSDDWTEKAQLVRFAVMTHELGHSLGLKHGGGKDINFKPNYPSLMNYAFDVSFNGAPQTLQDTEIQFSSGNMPDLDEAAVIEVATFPGIPGSELNYLKYYKNKKSKASIKNIQGDFCEAGQGDLCLDWNGDGLYSPDPHEFIITGGNSPRLLKDHNDFKVIAKKMAKPLSAKPNCMLQHPSN